MSSALLPPNATALERALADVASPETAVDVAAVWDPDRCPPALLPWLAHALSVDEWDSGWSDEVKRDVIRQSVSIHRRKGTVSAVKDALVAAGFGDAALIEQFNPEVYDGAFTYDGAIDYASPDHWAEYRVNLASPVTIARAAQARAIIESAAPVRSHLVSLTFTEVARTYDGSVFYDGVYSYGEA